MTSERRESSEIPYPEWLIRSDLCVSGDVTVYWRPALRVGSKYGKRRNVRGNREHVQVTEAYGNNVTSKITRQRKGADQLNLRNRLSKELQGQRPNFVARKKNRQRLTVTEIVSKV